MTKHYRINSRTRFTLFVVIAIILLTTIVNFTLGLNTASSSTAKEYREIEISSGDTLWHIAETYMSDNSDIREAVYELCQLNDMSADQLHAGMTILVPVY